MNENELQSFKRQIHELVDNEFEVIGNKIEETDKVPPEFWQVCRENHLLGATVPKEYGGLGLTQHQWFQIFEEVARAHGTIRMIIHNIGGGLPIKILMKYGTKEQQDEYLPKMVTKEWWGGFALTEPNTGSGADISTTATKKGNNWVLNGEKHLISFPDLVDSFITLGVTDPSRDRNSGFTSFIVHKDNPGCIIDMWPGGMGLRGSTHCTVTFRDCVVPPQDVVGKVGEGLKLFLDVLDLSRAAVAVGSLGLAQRALEMALKYSKERVTFGKPICQRQAIQQMLAEIATPIHALRLMIMDCAQKYDQGLDIRKESAMCKVFGIETVRIATDKALEVHGGRGYFKLSNFERVYRDSRSTWLEEGTPTIQKMVIARAILKD